MAVTYSAKNVTVDADAGSVVFTVERSGTTAELNQPSSVTYETRDITAKAGTDYTKTSGTLAFAAAQTSGQVTVPILAAAFETSGIKTFLLHLDDFGSATATVSPELKIDRTQGYWLIPGDGDKLPIPTSDGTNHLADAQMDVSKFSAPPQGDSSEALPHTYFRLGHARPDMNFPERLVASSEGFFATARDSAGKVKMASDQAPREPGAALEYMKPRNINRERDGWRDKKVDNKHLDGIFLYTEGSLTTSTLASATYVINGDYSLYVGGETRQTYMGDVTSIYLSPTDGITRYAEGAQSVDGEYIDYEIKGLRSLEVMMEDSARYATSNEFAVNTASQVELFTGVKYEVSNAVKFEVTGLDISAKCDVLGNYEIDYMAGEIASTRTESNLAATEEIVLQIDPVGAAARKVAVGAFTGTNMAVAAAAAITAAVPFASSEEGLENDFADSIRMKTGFARLMNAGYPDTFRTLAGVGAAVLIGVVAAQKIAAIAPNPLPKISMTPLDIKLSVGATSLVLSETGIEYYGPGMTLNVLEGFTVRAMNLAMTVAQARLQTAKFTVVSPETSIEGNTEFIGDHLQTGYIGVTGVVFTEL